MPKNNTPARLAAAANAVETPEQELARLRAENEALKAKAKGAERGLTLKVSQKGALSVYGLGRFPVTLYKEQWVRLMDKRDDVLAFIADNDKALASKDDPKPEAAPAKPALTVA